MLWNLARMCWSNLPRAFRSCGTLLFPALQFPPAYSLPHRSTGSTSLWATLRLLVPSNLWYSWYPSWLLRHHWLELSPQKLLLNGLNFSYFLMSGCFSKHLVLICFPCGVLYELFHYASNTILDPYPFLLPELKRPEDRWVGDPTGKCLVVWVFCLGCFSQCASWCLQSSLFQFAALIEQCNCLIV